jgi:hypothetical protein
MFCLISDNTNARQEINVHPSIFDALNLKNFIVTMRCDTNTTAKAVSDTAPTPCDERSHSLNLPSAEDALAVVRDALANEQPHWIGSTYERDLTALLRHMIAATHFTAPYAAIAAQLIRQSVLTAPAMNNRYAPQDLQALSLSQCEAINNHAAHRNHCSGAAAANTGSASR